MSCPNNRPVGGSHNQRYRHGSQESARHCLANKLHPNQTGSLNLYLTVNWSSPPNNLPVPIATAMGATVVVGPAEVGVSSPVVVKIVGLTGIVAPSTPISVVPIAAVPIHWATFEIRWFSRRDVRLRWIVPILSLGRRRGHKARRSYANAQNAL